MGRRGGAAVGVALLLLRAREGGAAAAADRRLAEAFERAARSGADFEAADRLWTEAIDISGGRSAVAWSNRGVRRLQENAFALALSDLETAAGLESDEFGAPSSYVQVQLGNCLGARSSTRSPYPPRGAPAAGVAARTGAH